MEDTEDTDLQTETATDTEPAAPATPSIAEHVITDIRALFAHDEPGHLEVVSDIRDPEGRGVLADPARRDGLGLALSMRHELHNAGVDPHAVSPDADPDLRRLAVEYLEHLQELRRARLTEFAGQQ